MKKLFSLLMCGLLLLGCDKNDDNSTSPLPALPDPDDVCSCMEDLVFMQYCYDNFDVNHDGKVSRQEAEAVRKIAIGLLGSDLPNLRSLKGIGYFSNLEILNCCNCKQLESVDLSKNLKITTIQDFAFTNCSSLTSITIPNSITSIGTRAFAGCDRLSTFYGKLASNDNRCLIVDGSLAAFAPANLTAYTIPNNVTSIGEEAFFSCTSLTSITIPDSVTSIGEDAFSGCSSLTSLYCKPQNPPTITSLWWFEHNLYLLRIYVPRASVEAYKTTGNWAQYADQIVGYDF